MRENGKHGRDFCSFWASNQIKILTNILSQHVLQWIITKASLGPSKPKFAWQGKTPLVGQIKRNMEQPSSRVELLLLCPPQDCLQIKGFNWPFHINHLIWCFRYVNILKYRGRIAIYSHYRLCDISQLQLTDDNILYCILTCMPTIHIECLSNLSQFSGSNGLAKPMLWIQPGFWDWLGSAHLDLNALQAEYHIELQYNISEKSYIKNMISASPSFELTEAYCSLLPSVIGFAKNLYFLSSFGRRSSDIKLTMYKK